MGVGSRTSGEGGIGRPARIWLVLLFCLSLVCVGGASAAVTEAEAQETNAAPVAKDNEYRVKKDGTLRISNPGVLRNDLDPDGDRLSASRQSSPRHGRLSLRSGGSFVYTPDKGYRGKDSFVYEAADATGGTDTATVEITVWSPDRLPLARNNAYGVEEDKILTVPAPGVLKNDAEAYGRSLFATKVTDPGNGSLSLNRNGSFVYTPDADFDGEDSFVYRARDNKGHDDQGTVRIAVGAVNDAPVFTGAAGNTSQTIDEGAELAALEATDADGDTLTFELTGGSLPPGITLENGGRFAGVAGGRAAGNYTADIKVSDGDGEAASTRLEVTVNPVEEAAVASDADVTTDEDVAKTITLSATDADTDNLTFSINPPGEGTLGPPSAPDCNTSAGTATCTTTVLYTPDADYNGPDSFTYTAGDSASATVRITVNAVNDKPVAEADSKTTPENTPLVFPASDLVANDSEGAANENAQTLTVTEVTNPQHGTVVLEGGEITFTPQTDYNGPASFDYTVCDSGQECSTQTAKVNVTVSPVNSRPTASATPESLDIDEDAVAQTVTLAGADSETGAANLRFKITEAPTHGVLKQETTTLGTDDGFTGSPTDVTYKPDADYNGSDSFRFEVTDRGDPDNCGAPAAA
jgi:large repetitive protein